MDVAVSWRRKRPVEDDEYTASKKYISEKFFNMRISQPQTPGQFGVPSMPAGAADAAGSGDEFEIESNGMADVVHPLNGTPSDVPMKVSPIKPVTDDAVTTDDDSDLDFDLDSLDDEPAPRLSRGSTNSRVITDLTSGASANPPTHPFLRKASSSVDEKVDDWIRTSRHRLLADASVDAAPDLCRALVVYKPLGPAGAQTDTDGAGGGDGCGGSGGKAGGDPTPSPMAGSDSGDGIAVAGAGTAQARGAVFKEQSAGSSTAEATGSTGGGGGRNGDANSHHGAASRGLAGLCVSPSGGDDAGGTMSDRSDATGKGLPDEMEVDAATEGDEVLEPWSDDQPDEQPALTRVGTSRGMPTPELTPEWAAQARGSTQRRGQDSGESAGGPSLAASYPEGWGRW